MSAAHPELFAPVGKPAPSLHHHKRVKHRTFHACLAGLFASIFSTIALSSAWAYENPLRDSSKLLEPIKQVTERVRTAQILKVDYALIRRDFPETRTFTNTQIDQALLEAAGRISKAQLSQNVVNTAIEVEPGREADALRPLGYGRALIFKFFGGWLDGKGAGGLGVRQKSHSNGLASLTEALREFMFEKLVANVLGHAKYAPGTVECYAVIDYGFDIINEDGSRSPAGLVLRQAHERENGVGRLPVKEAQAVERILRRYGIISDFEAMKYGYQTIDRQNVQGAKDRHIFDHGAMRVLPPDVALNQSPVNPDENLRVPAKDWQYINPGRERAPMNDQLELDIDELVSRWRKQEITRADVDAFVKARLGPIVARYRNQCAAVFAR